MGVKKDDKKDEKKDDKKAEKKDDKKDEKKDEKKDDKKDEKKDDKKDESSSTGKAKAEIKSTDDGVDLKNYDGKSGLDVSDAEFNGDAQADLSGKLMKTFATLMIAFIAM